MSNLVTKYEIHLSDWRGYGPLTIPAGLKVSRTSYGNKSGQFIYFLEDFAKLFDRQAQIMQLHDAEYYGISLNPADVAELATLVERI